MVRVVLHDLPPKYSVISLPAGRSEMYSKNIAVVAATFSRNLLPTAKYFIPLAAFSRSQKTEAAPLKQNESLHELAKPEIEHEDGEGRPFDDIPGPKRNWKSMMEFYVKSEGFAKGFKLNQRMFAEYGPIFKENTLVHTNVHVMDPDDYEKVFRAEGKYPRRPVIDAWVEHRKRRQFFPGLILLDGEEWRRVRQSISPKMMRPKMVEENIDNFNAITNDAIARFVKLKEACGPDDHIPDLEGELSRFSTESIGTVAFDVRLGLYEDPPKEEALKFIDAVQNFFLFTHKVTFSIPSNMIRPYMDTPAFKKFLKYADDIVHIGQDFINKKMKELKEMAEKGIEYSDETEVVSLLTYLLTKKELTPEEVNGLAIDVIFAGVDTTSTSLLWLMYNLGSNPEVQEKLFQEIDSVVGKDEDITTKHLAKLSYLKACLKESMRLCPILVQNARILEQDIVLSGYNVPKQTNIILELYSTARSEKYFKDPLEFKPERWLRENKDENHAFSNLYFGFGTRMCLGRRVAEMEIYLLLSKLLQRFCLEYDSQPLVLHQKLIAVPDKPVKIKFVDRR